jgi:hypothetical protein
MQVVKTGLIAVKYPTNLMSWAFEKKIGNDLEVSLANLKAALERK